MVLERCFPELWGFVLLDPLRLDAAVPDAEGSDLLALFGSGDIGDQVAAEGIAVPMLNLTAGYYTVVLHDRLQAPRWTEPVLSSSGWVLGTETGELLLCGAGYLTRWSPSHGGHRRVTIPPGWYELKIDVFRLGPDSEDDFALDLTATPVPTRPTWSADLSQDFSMD